MKSTASPCGKAEKRAVKFAEKARSHSYDGPTSFMQIKLLAGVLCISDRVRHKILMRNWLSQLLFSAGNCGVVQEEARGNAPAGPTRSAQIDWLARTFVVFRALV